MPAKRYKVIAKVISQTGRCGAGHKVGDEFVIERHTPAGICLSAFNSMFPSVRVLAFGGQFPYGDNPDAATAACPDFRNPVVFEIKRVTEE